jgi:HAD superfamily hydrolase (TIGR01459 family)
MSNLKRKSKTNIQDIKSIGSLEEISKNYDFFIVDVYGVIYDGETLLTDALLALEKLLKQTSNIVFLSNSAISSEYLKRKLMNLDREGKYKSVFDKILLRTSGDAFVKYFVKRLIKESDSPLMVIGGGENKDIVDRINMELKLEGSEPIRITKNPAEAKYVLILASNNVRDANAIQETMYELESAAKHDLVCLCANPDVSSPMGGEIFYTAGYYAEEYIRLGKEVLYFGKPYKPLYSSVLLEFDVDDIDQFKKSKRILVIGDSMENDILGAHNIGVDSLLIGSTESVSECAEKLGRLVLPTFMINNLK